MVRSTLLVHKRANYWSNMCYNMWLISRVHKRGQVSKRSNDTIIQEYPFCYGDKIIGWGPPMVRYGMLRV